MAATEPSSRFDRHAGEPTGGFYGEQGAGSGERARPPPAPGGRAVLLPDLHILLGGKIPNQLRRTHEHDIGVVHPRRQRLCHHLRADAPGVAERDCDARAHLLEPLPSRLVGPFQDQYPSALLLRSRRSLSVDTNVDVGLVA